MKNWKVWAVVGAIALLIVVPFASQALADGYDQGIWANLWDLLVNEVAEATGLTVDEVNQALEQGQTLREIAEAHGADPDAIVASVVERAGAVIDQAVESGLMDADQAELARTMLENRVEMMMLMPWNDATIGPGVGMWDEEMWDEAWAERLDDMPEEMREMAQEMEEMMEEMMGDSWMGGGWWMPFRWLGRMWRPFGGCQGGGWFSRGHSGDNWGHGPWGHQ